jgi:hypothetical protein
MTLPRHMVKGAPYYALPPVLIGAQEEQWPLHIACLP